MTSTSFVSGETHWTEYLRIISHQLKLTAFQTKRTQEETYPVNSRDISGAIALKKKDLNGDISMPETDLYGHDLCFVL